MADDQQNGTTEDKDSEGQGVTIGRRHGAEDQDSEGQGFRGKDRDDAEGEDDDSERPADKYRI